MAVLACLRLPRACAKPRSSGRRRRASALSPRPRRKLAPMPPLAVPCTLQPSRSNSKTRLALLNEGGRPLPLGGDPPQNLSGVPLRLAWDPRHVTQVLGHVTRALGHVTQALGHVTQALRHVTKCLTVSTRSVLPTVTVSARLVTQGPGSRICRVSLAFDQPVVASPSKGLGACRFSSLHVASLFPTSRTFEPTSVHAGSELCCSACWSDRVPADHKSYPRRRFGRGPHRLTYFALCVPIAHPAVQTLL